MPDLLPDDLQGIDLREAIVGNQQLMAGALEGFHEIERGENAVVTLDDLRESLENGEPII